MIKKLQEIKDYIFPIDWEAVIVLGVFIVLILLALTGRGGMESYPGN